MSVVIGVGYKARHGKDSAVQAIIAARGADYDVRRYAFADELKIEVSDAICDAGNIANFFADWDALLPEWVVIETDPDMTDPLCPFGKHRTLLQWYGTEYRRAQDAEYWVKRLAARITKEQPAVAIISDMRFFNEFDYVQNSLGYHAKVTRKGFVSDVANHIGETMLDDVPPSAWDFHINVATVEELRRDAVAMFDEIAQKDSRVICRAQA